MPFLYHQLSFLYHLTAGSFGYYATRPAASVIVASILRTSSRVDGRQRFGSDETDQRAQLARFAARLKSLSAFALTVSPIDSALTLRAPAM
jgi:hypothetical protein